MIARSPGMSLSGWKMSPSASLFLVLRIQLHTNIFDTLTLALRKELGIWSHLPRCLVPAVLSMESQKQDSSSGQALAMHLHMLGTPSTSSGSASSHAGWRKPGGSMGTKDSYPWSQKVFPKADCRQEASFWVYSDVQTCLDREVVSKFLGATQDHQAQCKNPLAFLWNLSCLETTQPWPTPTYSTWSLHTKAQPTAPPTSVCYSFVRLLWKSVDLSHRKCQPSAE